MTLLFGVIPKCSSTALEILSYILTFPKKCSTLSNRLLPKHNLSYHSSPNNVNEHFKCFIEKIRSYHVNCFMPVEFYTDSASRDLHCSLLNRIPSPMKIFVDHGGGGGGRFKEKGPVSSLGWNPSVAN